MPTHYTRQLAHHYEYLQRVASRFGCAQGMRTGLRTVLRNAA
jgi:hypothetical protein